MFHNVCFSSATKIVVASGFSNSNILDQIGALLEFSTNFLSEVVDLDLYGRFSKDVENIPNYLKAGIACGPAQVLFVGSKEAKPTLEVKSDAIKLSEELASQAGDGITLLNEEREQYLIFVCSDSLSSFPPLQMHGIESTLWIDPQGTENLCPITKSNILCGKKARFRENEFVKVLSTICLV